MKHVFIIGCKGLPARYGGFETFTDNLVSRKKNKNIQYHVACLSGDSKNIKEFVYNGALCKEIYVPNIGGARAILYDVKSLNWALKIINKEKLKNGYVYILGCTIGPLINLFEKRLKKKNFSILLNPDGHEWARDKWAYPVKKYLKFSEREMIKKSDCIICDSTSIREYVKEEYSKYSPVTTYISYGADLIKTTLKPNSYKVRQYFSENKLEKDGYFLVVGRFVPENNYETIIKEFIRSRSEKDLVIITNYMGNKFFEKLRKKTEFNKDKRIKFVGTVYDTELLKYLRENAFAYIHGHSVGGTNPSLLEALSTTKLNLLYDIGFNSEVAKTSALYWNKNKGSLASLIDEVSNFDEKQRENYYKKGLQIIHTSYSWDKIISKYERLFLN